MGYIKSIVIYLIFFSLNIFPLDTFQHIRNITSLLNTTSIELLDDHSLLISSDGGVYTFDINSSRFHNYTNNLEYIDINTINRYHNTFWLVGSDGNIQILDENLNLDYVIDYTNFSSIEKVVFYEDKNYAFGIGSNLFGEDLLIQYSIGDSPNYLNYMSVDDIFESLGIKPDNNKINDIIISDDNLHFASTEGYFKADLSNYNSNLLSVSLEFEFSEALFVDEESSLFIEEFFLFIDDLIYFKYDNKICVESFTGDNLLGVSGTPPCPFPGDLNIIDAYVYNDKIYSLFEQRLLIISKDNPEEIEEEFQLPNDIRSKFKDILILGSDIYIGLKNHGILKVNSLDFSDFEYIIPNTLFSNHITALDVKDNRMIAGLAAQIIYHDDVAPVLFNAGGFIIDDINVDGSIRNFYSDEDNYNIIAINANGNPYQDYGNHLYNFPIVDGYDNVKYIGKNLQYVSGNQDHKGSESPSIKFNNRGELYFLNSGVYLDPATYGYSHYENIIDNFGYADLISFYSDLSSLIQLDPTTLTISNSWGENIFTGQRGLYNCGWNQNHTIVTQLLFDDYDNIWVVNPYSEGEHNKPICIIINNKEKYIEDHSNPEDCETVENEYLLPQEIAFDSYNNAWISYFKDQNTDYSPGGIRMVEIKGMYNTNDADIWHNNIIFSNDNECDVSLNNVSVFSIDIGSNKYGDTILWALSQIGAIGYIVNYTYSSSSNFLTLDIMPINCSFDFSDMLFDEFSKIRVDKQNNAWVISRDGARVIQSNGEILLDNFTINSNTTELFSDNINDIAFDDNGYVYFATDKGLSIFRTTFAEDKSIKTISVSPNPFIIGEDNGLTISNFPSGSVIHIMNLSGQVVKEFKLEGQNVILDWNGKGNNGRYLNTGIYLVGGFHSSQIQGVTKLAIIRK